MRTNRNPCSRRFLTIVRAALFLRNVKSYLRMRCMWHSVDMYGLCENAVFFFLPVPLKRSNAVPIIVHVLQTFHPAQRAPRACAYTEQKKPRLGMSEIISLFSIEAHTICTESSSDARAQPYGSITRGASYTHTQVKKHVCTCRVRTRGMGEHTCARAHSQNSFTATLV